MHIGEASVQMSKLKRKVVMLDVCSYGNKEPFDSQWSKPSVTI